MINLAVALTLLNGFLLVSNLKAITENKSACTAIAVVVHFSLFSALLWTSVEASYVCLGIAAVRNVLFSFEQRFYDKITCYILVSVRSSCVGPTLAVKTMLPCYTLLLLLLVFLFGQR